MTEKKSFREVAMLWKEEKRQFVKLSTFAAYSLALEKHLLPVFGSCTKITEAEVQSFVIDKLQSLSRRTVQDMLIVLKMVYRYGVKHHHLQHAEWHISYPTMRDSRNVAVLSVAHQKRLLAHVRGDITFRNLGILLCLSTGLRIGELCALTWQDINLSRRVVTVSKTLERIYLTGATKPSTRLVIGPPKTRHSCREVPITNELVRILTPLMKAVNPSDFVLTNGCRPTEPRSYRNYYNRLLRCLDIPAIKFHGLRHSFATRCIESRCDCKTVSVILGHANIATTLNLYVHPNLEQKHKCISRMLKNFAP